MRSAQLAWMCFLEQSSQLFFNQCSQAPHYDAAADLLFWATYSHRQFREEAYCCRVLILNLDSAAVEWAKQYILVCSIKWTKISNLKDITTVSWEVTN